MKHCKLFLHPAVFEGFGIPPLEALALGAPIALANATCLPELYGDTARYFDPYDYDTDLDRLAAQPVAAPDEVLQKYSWDRTAQFLAARDRKVRETVIKAFPGGKPYSHRKEPTAPHVFPDNDLPHGAGLRAVRAFARKASATQRHKAGHRLGRRPMAGHLAVRGLCLHRPGLTVGFNAFRLVAVTALNGWTGFVTAGLRSFGRKGLKAVVPLLLVTALGLEVFVARCLLQHSQL